MTNINSSIQLPCGTVLQNRLMKSAMSETLGNDHFAPTPELIRLYERWGSSGIGLLITGNVMIDRHALGEPGNVVIEDERDLDMLKAWAAAAPSGTQIWVQLNHPGKQAPKGLNPRNISPSAVPFHPKMQALFATPEAATEAEIQDIIRRFAQAARICKKAGFHGVQIHGAHGYLVSQFLSPHHNQRTDAWGGSPENRRRFVLEVYRAIRAEVGPAFPVGIKLNSADFQRGGLSEEESMGTIAALAEAGMDLIEVSGGTYEAPVMTGAVPAKASTAAREAYFLEFAEKVRGKTSVPLAVTGGFRSPAGMNAALDSGALDIVGIARLMAIDPDAPRHLLQGKASPASVRPIRTGVGAIDNAGILEISWYALQLRRIGEGRATRPHEGAWMSLAKTLVHGLAGRRSVKRARAAG